MNELVNLKGKEIFTTSEVIANGVGIKHKSITSIILKYKSDFEEFGELISDLKSLIRTKIRDKKTTVYLLNEEQSTLLITYLKNNEVVRNFKKQIDF